MSNTALSEFTCMHYLVSLTGSARVALKRIPLTADNFAMAWETLIKRFENPRRLIRHHLSNLLGLAAVRGESLEELHALIDRTNVEVTSLAKLGRPPRNFGATYSAT
ncbi:hypothetical protein WN55_09459 [Dufourea novaeangliae]|uniref:Uncharacterized protein n=1 Tax=Dufourea novaeangliae TaxID=178035 RepID=A0A154P9P7_DUFNO|nr:hypothetical protein WN55_09459 [Dufourea novaeangliae]